MSTIDTSSAAASDKPARPIKARPVKGAPPPGWTRAQRRGRLLKLACWYHVAQTSGYCPPRVKRVVARLIRAEAQALGIWPETRETELGPEIIPIDGVALTIDDAIAFAEGRR